MTLSEILGVSTFDHMAKSFSILKWAHRTAVIMLFIALYFVYLPVLMESDLRREIDPDLMHFEISARFLTSVLALLVQFFKNHLIKQAFFRCLTFKFKENDYILAKYWKYPLISLTIKFLMFLFNFFIFHFTYSINSLANFHYTVFAMFYVEFPCLQFNYLVMALHHCLDKMNNNMEQILEKVSPKKF